MTIDGKVQGGGVDGFGIAEEEVSPFSGTGGAAGPGTRAGKGQPSGEGIGSDGLVLDGSGHAANEETSAPDETVPSRDKEAATEAAALGKLDDHDETPALEYGEGDRPNAPTIGEALGSGTGSSVGSGTPKDRSGLAGSTAQLPNSNEEDEG